MAGSHLVLLGGTVVVSDKLKDFKVLFLLTFSINNLLIISLNVYTINGTVI